MVHPNEPSDTSQMTILTYDFDLLEPSTSIASDARSCLTKSSKKFLRQLRDIVPDWDPNVLCGQISSHPETLDSPTP